MWVDPKFSPTPGFTVCLLILKHLVNECVIVQRMQMSLEHPLSWLCMVLSCPSVFSVLFHPSHSDLSLFPLLSSPVLAHWFIVLWYPARLSEPSVTPLMRPQTPPLFFVFSSCLCSSFSTLLSPSLSQPVSSTLWNHPLSLMFYPPFHTTWPWLSFASWFVSAPTSPPVFSWCC